MGYFFQEILKEAEIDWEDVSSFFVPHTVNSRTTLLYEGEISNHIFFIKKGALRLWHNDNGQDITLQFFFEGQIVSSFESFYSREESMFSIESLEKTDYYVLSREKWMYLLKEYPLLNQLFTKIVTQRFMEYSKLFLSRIKYTPKKRYLELFEQQSIILQRVPDYYIASYLGITPVSYSRIKQRVKKELKN
ncbi:Crp/Fnr family transcriptional regulator [Enterococcus mundtii]|uniref:Crp/Fnr family transcriptional regulator n=1 Tax=Enterococcus TaxID=1350 RepID=UPI0008E4E067|nr:Crp/Fnr family transcriptional regulator [Enterococcus mundtii]SFM33530.1 cAMP-binding domain of CRP or a regulatory subunit of cAMP-dependent protein kinases [Enterococcus mundtii]